MHESVEDWMTDQTVALRLADRSVLDVGSYDVNGNNRYHFAGPYIGVDMREGPNVDVVCDGAALPFPDRSFDAVVSTECLEHASRFWRLCEEMARVTKEWVLVTTRGNGYGQHDYPGDYWRFMPGALSAVFADLGMDAEESEDPQAPGVFCTARRD